MNLRENLIHLVHCRGIGRKTIAKMLKFDPSLVNVFSLSKSQLQSSFTISPTKIDIFYEDLKKINVHQLLQKYQKAKIHLITIFDSVYPNSLRNTYDPPLVLFGLGNIDLLNSSKMLAIVGTRKPTSYGINVTKKLTKDLVEKDVLIVSGLAKGIDKCAHEAAISSSGKTIAVLGSGFLHIYPKENLTLAKEIATSHLLLSEYPPHTKPQKYYFPERNRIISGLSSGTLVIEAKAKSGSLITAEFALNEGRDVFAIPGPITSETSVGTNYLIQEGAKLVLSAADILAELPEMK